MVKYYPTKKYKRAKGSKSNSYEYRPYRDGFNPPDEIAAKSQFDGKEEKYLPDLLTYFNEKEAFESEKYHAWQSIEPSLWLLHIYESYTDANNYKLVDCLVDDLYQVVVYVAQEYVVGGVTQENFSDSPFYDYNNFLSSESREYKEDNHTTPGLMKYIKEYMPTYTFLGFSERPTDFTQLRDLFLTRMNSDPPRLPEMPIRSEAELDAEIDAPEDDMENSIYANLHRPGQPKDTEIEGVIDSGLPHDWEPFADQEYWPFDPEISTVYFGNTGFFAPASFQPWYISIDMFKQFGCLVGGISDGLIKDGFKNSFYSIDRIPIVLLSPKQAFGREDVIDFPYTERIDDMYALHARIQTDLIVYCRQFLAYDIHCIAYVSEDFGFTVLPTSGTNNPSMGTQFTNIERSYSSVSDFANDERNWILESKITAALAYLAVSTLISQVLAWAGATYMAPAIIEGAMLYM